MRSGGRLLPRGPGLRWAWALDAHLRRAAMAGGGESAGSCPTRRDRRDTPALGETGVSVETYPCCGAVPPDGKVLPTDAPDKQTAARRLELQKTQATPFPALCSLRAPACATPGRHPRPDMGAAGRRPGAGKEPEGRCERREARGFGADVGYSLCA